MRNFLKAMDETYELGIDNAKNNISECPFDPIKQPAEENQWKCGYRYYIDFLSKSNENISND